MPKKIRELKAALASAGFAMRPGKGSHTVWSHPRRKKSVTIAGKVSGCIEFKDKTCRSNMFKAEEASLTPHICALVKHFI